jgi:hypothetical protein
MSLPDDWVVYQSDLIKRSSDGKESTRQAILELERAGFITIQRRRNKNGQMNGWNYLVHEVPPNAKPNAGIPSSENPMPGLSDSTDEPLVSDNQCIDIPVDRLEEEVKAPVATAPGRLLSPLSEKTCCERSCSKGDSQTGSAMEGGKPVRKDDDRNRLITRLRKAFSAASGPISRAFNIDKFETYTLLVQIIPDLDDPQAKMFYRMPIEELSKQIEGALIRLEISISSTKKIIRSPGGYLYHAMKRSQKELMKWANQFDFDEQEGEPCKR